MIPGASITNKKDDEDDWEKADRCAELEAEVASLRARLDKAEASAAAAWRERDEMRNLLANSDKVIVSASWLVADLVRRVPR